MLTAAREIFNGSLPRCIQFAFLEAFGDPLEGEDV
jgi:hypothetical protein